MKKHIPNFVTLLNLFCGSVAAIFAISGNLKLAAFFVLSGIFFDYIDGYLAKILNAQSALGLHLDSLADVVTSGLVPGLIMFQLLKLSGPDWDNSISLTDSFSFTIDNLLPFIGLFITLASAYRLANFNVSTNQTENFIGMPTPANALLILSFPLILEFQNNDLMNAVILNKWFLIAITFISCFLLNANVKLLALKFRNWSFKDNSARYMLIILSAILLVIFKFAAIPLIIITYIIVSLLNK